MVDETAASDADYIYTTTASVCKLRLGPVKPPAVGATQTIRVRLPDGFVPNGTLTTSLYQGAATLVATRTEAAPSANTTYEYALTAGEAATITDYDDLRLWLEAA